MYVVIYRDYLQVVNLACWAVATATALAVLYGLYHASQGHPVSLPVSALYNAVSRTAWGSAVAWVIFACVTGNGGQCVCNIYVSLCRVCVWGVCV